MRRLPGRTLLFVYGTLADGRAPVRVRRALARAARPVGRAWLRAVRYRLGAWPGAVPRRDGPRLEGLLLALPDDPRLWRLLDRYEDADPAHPERGEFHRERVVVRRIPDGRTLEAWMYVWNRRGRRPLYSMRQGPRGRAASRRRDERWPRRS